MNKNFIVNNDRIEIPSSKLKIFFLLLLGIIFVSMGVYFILHPEQFAGNGYRRRPVLEIIVMGYFGTVFFGFCTIAAILMLFSSKPGLIIDDNGITIPGLFYTAFVSWDMIKKFDVIKISRSKLIGIYLKNPVDYVNNINNATARKLAQFSLNGSGTPISVSTNSLKCNTDELLVLLEEKIKNNSEI